MVWGVTKTNCMDWKCSRAYSWFINRLSSKFYLVDIFQNPNKIKQNPNFLIPNPLSYHISSKPTKIKHLSHFTTQKSNSHPTKNSSTNPKSSLFISTFTDNDFHLKNRTKSSLITVPTQGVLKNYIQNHSNKRITI